MGNVDLFSLGQDLDKTQNDGLLQQCQKTAAQLYVLKQDLQKIEPTPYFSHKKIEDAITGQMQVLESRIKERLDTIL